MISVVLALGIDRLLGEPRRFHPLVGAGHCANAIEAWLNQGNRRRMNGLFATLLIVLPPVTFVAVLRPEGLLTIAFDAFWLWLVIGLRSLNDHTTPIERALHAGDVAEARRRTGWIVSRDTETLDANGCRRAAIESLLENGNDAVIAPLFWYCVAGPAGAVAHRLINTLDAMWGYKTERYHAFGWFAARSDDLMAWVPARMTALGYALAGQFKDALECWSTQAHRLASPNGGPCMTAGAGALGITLGGPCDYHGQRVDKPEFGKGPSPDNGDIVRAQHLLQRCLAGWLIALMTLTVLL